ncbi:MAG: DUF4214 domain-containing protein [Gemmataceae bacterium]|nr:DUF4214 domain-containing protein [Gemmataceae bacterium]
MPALLRTPCPRHPQKTCRLQTHKPQVEALEDRLVPDATFVNALFHQYLGRDPGGDGRAYWDGQMEAGASRADVARGILRSPEGNGVEVQRLYQRMLGRPADEGAGWFWNVLQSGGSTKDAQVLLSSSDEFLQRAGGTNEKWLDAMYANLLGRAPDAADRDYWLGTMANGASRFDVAQAIRRSPEAATASAVGAYTRILGYAPDQGGKEWWTLPQLQGMSVEEMEAQIAGSAAAAAQLAQTGEFAGTNPDLFEGVPFSPDDSQVTPGFDVLGGIPVDPGFSDVPFGFDVLGGIPVDPADNTLPFGFDILGGEAFDPDVFELLPGFDSIGSQAVESNLFNFTPIPSRVRTTTQTTTSDSSSSNIRTAQFRPLTGTWYYI